MAITSREKAQVAEAINRHPMSPIARQLGIELLNRANKQTGECWPSEARLALALGCDPRSIRRAKAELKAAGLLSWKTRGWHKTPIYRLAWEALKALGATIKAKVRAAFTPALRQAPKSSPAITPPPARSVAPAHLSIAPADRDSGRTFSSTDLTQTRNIKGALEGIGRPPAANSRPQVLTDQQLNARASARLWEALRRCLDRDHLQFLTGQLTEAIETAAVKSERYSPGSGLAVLRRLMDQPLPR